MIRPFRQKTRNIGPLIGVSVLFIGGVVAFWFGLRAFRTHADAQKAQGELASLDGANEIGADIESIPYGASLFASSGGGEVGRMTRVFAQNVATIDVLVSLPAIENSAFTYDVWLVKDGLADVVDLGALTPRADGSWAGTFVAGPATGVVDPTLFSEVVIMLEPRDDHAEPSGMKVCEGAWK